MIYPPESRGQIMSSVFRANRRGMFVKKTLLEHLNKPIKSVGRARFIKTVKDKLYKETCWFFVILFIIFLQLIQMSDNTYGLNDLRCIRLTDIKKKTC